MNTKLHVMAVMAFLVVLAAATCLPAADDPFADLRKNAEKVMRDGNFKDALEIYQKMALDKDDTPKLVGEDMQMAVSCLQNLDRISEMDSFAEKTINIHSNNWNFLYSAAQTYVNAEHNGAIIAGTFERGSHRGGGRYVNSYERDRVRAMQLMQQAMEIAEKEISANQGDKSSIVIFYVQFARTIMGYRGYGEAWRLQYLSDLSKLPDYDEGYYGWGGEERGAPVDADGAPVLHKIPKSYADAKTDGERWRWLLNRTMELNPTTRNDVMMDYANFLHQQFGVQTMASWGWRAPAYEDGDNGKKKDESGAYALHTLADDETIARLANGIKRFKLPEDGDFINIYQKVANNKGTGHDQLALNTLAQIYEDRRQYDKAAGFWKRSIEQCGDSKEKWKQKRLDQILGNWGQFEPVMTHPAGEEATVEFRFRNGTKVAFEAHEINVRQILADVKEYLKSNPKELDWEKLNIGNIGYMLVQKDQDKYVGRKVDDWNLKLEPRPMHFDKRVTVKTPLKKAGAYLLTATMEGGNTSKIIIWLDDTVIIKKQLDKKAYFFVADAITGEPLPKMNVEFFGYRQESLNWNKMLGRHYNVLTTAFAEFTDDNGQVMLDSKDLNDNYQWIISATPSAGSRLREGSGGQTGQANEGRLAYLGFTHVWYGSYYDQEYNQTKVFGITDRPVYRPNQSAKFKFWIRKAQYDQENVSDFAKQDFAVIVLNPKQEKVFEKTFTTDEYAGLAGELPLPKDAMLGVYYAYVWQHGSSLGGINFRVEEYKKPEFEVEVKAPTEPIMLGEKITATIKAKYYFGTPVTKAKVKYKILRSDYSAHWYPICLWDWFYGPGYWWFAYDYKWYPGWRNWGCPRPLCWWWPVAHDPPEVVAETEVNIGEDGLVKVEIDTGPAKELHGDTDHRYEITAEVTDESRRTIVGQGAVLVARKPFKVYAWVDRGHYRVSDVIQADFSAQTLDNKPVKGKGELNLFKISYKNNDPVEKSAQKWDLNTDDEGKSHVQITASEPGQYRLSYKVTDDKSHAIEGGYVFCVMGDSSDNKKFRFNEIELVPDKKEYAPGEKVRLMINTDHADGTVILFTRPANGVYLAPKVIHLKGKSTVEEIEVSKKDMPNFFVEAFTISDGKLYEDTREIIVPPEKRVLNVEVLPSAEIYKPGEKAKVKVKLTDFAGKPFIGSTVISVYDRSVEYISGGSNVQEIKAFFWKWRRHHNPTSESSLQRYFYDLVRQGVIGMQNLGAFGDQIADEESTIAAGAASRQSSKRLRGYGGGGGGGNRNVMAKAPMADGLDMAAAPMSAMAEGMAKDDKDMGGIGGGEEEQNLAQPAIRSEFADTAFWIASLATDEKGTAEVEFKMPENLTGWKIKAWAMGHGTVVGEGSTDVVTAKNLMLRLQAPRFFVEKDEVVLSANIHNYLKSAKTVRAVLELEGGCLDPMNQVTQAVEIAANTEQRVDWRVKVTREGEATVRMKALTDEESDAMQMKFPVYVHGMLKTDSFSGVIRRDKDSASIQIDVPAERRVDESLLEVRYSPTLAGAMVDALPYLVEYPYGCTEQTLNRFLPTVITHKVLKDMGLDLKAIRDKRTNLNAQEIGDDKKRSGDWKRVAGDLRWNGESWEDRNPVFDEAVVTDMVKEGVKALTAMQLSDGGWGWFSGWGEQSWPHTTAYVVHGLQIAQQNGVAIVPGVLDRGVDWLRNYQAEELRKLKNAEKKIEPWKDSADNLDAFVHMVLVDAGKESTDMRDFLYRDRNNLAVYGKAMFGMALYKTGQKEKLDMILRNIEQLLVQDKENQTAYLNLGNDGYWWYWYGSEYEAQAYYLKLLALTDPKSDKAAGLVKYLLNNRKHATYWNSTRDTALCIEALADYLKASGEDKPDMTLEVMLDGRRVKEVKINKENLFMFDNKLILAGKEVETGKHLVELKRKGSGPVYFNAYLSNFTLEDFITKAGLEIKVNRKYYKLNRVDKTVKVAGDQGQALDQKVEKYERAELPNLITLKSGDLIEVELEIESKNDYEYIVFEDMKLAGFEPVEVRSGYNGNDMGAYVEFRDERVCMFVRALARGKHSVAYRTRAEIPGKFSALPTKASAMYAPELKANSDEIKLGISD
jgi:alpha-2-macroglobulin